MGERSHFDVDIDSLKAWEVLNGEIHWNGRVMKTTDEQKVFDMWKQFVESITVEWLVDNVVRSVHTFADDSFYTFSASGVFDIIWGSKWYSFKIPPHLRITNRQLEIRGLTSVEDVKLFKCLPIEVVEDFVRVVEL